MKLTILCGIPNAGKTTKAIALAEETGATLVRHDNYYSRIITPTTDVMPEHLRQVTELALADVKAALLDGEDVIYDATNDTKLARQRIKELCDVDGCEYVCIYMDTPEDICLERDTVGWTRYFALRFEPPTEDEGFELIVSNDGVGTEGGL